jgi:hypothetical protein
MNPVLQAPFRSKRVLSCSVHQWLKVISAALCNVTGRDPVVDTTGAKSRMFEAAAAGVRAMTPFSYVIRYTWYSLIVRLRECKGWQRGLQAIEKQSGHGTAGTVQLHQLAAMGSTR